MTAARAYAKLILTAICIQVASGFECPGYGRFADDSSKGCHDYVYCAKTTDGRNLTLHFTCPEGTLFNPESSKCESEEVFKCTDDDSFKVIPLNSMTVSGAELNQTERETITSGVIKVEDAVLKPVGQKLNGSTNVANITTTVIPGTVTLADVDLPELALVESVNETTTTIPIVNENVVILPINLTEKFEESTEVPTVATVVEFFVPNGVKTNIENNAILENRTSSILVTSQETASVPIPEIPTLVHNVTNMPMNVTIHTSSTEEIINREILENTPSSILIPSPETLVIPVTEIQTTVVNNTQLQMNISMPILTTEEIKNGEITQNVTNSILLSPQEIAGDSVIEMPTIVFNSTELPMNNITIQEMNDGVTNQTATSSILLSLQEITSSSVIEMPIIVVNSTKLPMDIAMHNTSIQEIRNGFTNQNATNSILLKPQETTIVPVIETQTIAVNNTQLPMNTLIHDSTIHKVNNSAIIQNATSSILLPPQENIFAPVIEMPMFIVNNTTLSINSSIPSLSTFESAILNDTKSPSTLFPYETESIETSMFPGVELIISEITTNSSVAGNKTGMIIGTEGNNNETTSVSNATETVKPEIIPELALSTETNTPIIGTTSPESKPKNITNEFYESIQKFPNDLPSAPESALFNASESTTKISDTAFSFETSMPFNFPTPLESSNKSSNQTKFTSVTETNTLTTINTPTPESSTPVPEFSKIPELSFSDIDSFMMTEEELEAFAQLASGSPTRLESINQELKTTTSQYFETVTDSTGAVFKIPQVPKLKTNATDNISADITTGIINFTDTSKATSIDDDSNTNTTETMDTVLQIPNFEPTNAEIQLANITNIETPLIAIQEATTSKITNGTMNIIPEISNEITNSKLSTIAVSDMKTQIEKHTLGTITDSPIGIISNTSDVTIGAFIKLTPLNENNANETSKSNTVAPEITSVKNTNSLDINKFTKIANMTSPFMLPSNITKPSLTLTEIVTPPQTTYEIMTEISAFETAPETTTNIENTSVMVSEITTISSETKPANDILTTELGSTQLPESTSTMISETTTFTGVPTFETTKNPLESTTSGSLPETTLGSTNTLPDTTLESTTAVPDTTLQSTTAVSDTTLQSTTFSPETTFGSTTAISETTLGSTNPVPDTTLESTTALPDTTLQSTTISPETTFGSTTAFPETTLGSTNTLPDTTLESTTAVPDTTLQSTTAVPDTTLQSTTFSPETTLGSTNPVPDTTLESTTALPDTTLQSSTISPETTFGSTTAFPETTLGSTNTLPDTTLESTTAVPDTTLQSTTAVPDTTLQSTTFSPETTFGSTTAFPETTLGSTNTLPDTTLESTTAVPDTTLQSTTAVPDTTLQSTTAVPDTTFQSTTAVPDTTFQSTTTFPETTFGSTNTPPDTTLESTTTFPETTLGSTNTLPDTTLELTTALPDTTLESTTASPETTFGSTTAIPDTTLDTTTPPTEITTIVTTTTSETVPETTTSLTTTEITIEVSTPDIETSTAIENPSTTEGSSIAPETTTEVTITELTTQEIPTTTLSSSTIPMTIETTTNIPTETTPYETTTDTVTVTSITTDETTTDVITESTTEIDTTTSGNIPFPMFICETTGRFPDSSDESCKNYLLCIKMSSGSFVQFKYTCLNNSFFNPVTQQCSSSYICPTSTAPQEDVILSDANSEPMFSCSSIGRHPDPSVSDCSGYILCINAPSGEFVQYQYKCLHPYVFNPYSRECSLNYECPQWIPMDPMINPSPHLTIPSTTTISPIVPTSEFVCNAAGRFPDDQISNCKGYIFCSRHPNGSFSKFNYLCFGNTKFDPYSKVCSENYICQNVIESIQIAEALSSPVIITTQPSTTSVANTIVSDPEKFTCTSTGRFLNSAIPGCAGYVLCLYNPDRGFTQFQFLCQSPSKFDPILRQCSVTYDCANNRMASMVPVQSFYMVPMASSSYPLQSPLYSNTISMTRTSSPFICKTMGRFEDPGTPNCGGYILCVRSQDGSFKQYQYSCSENTRFNPTSMLCSTSYTCPYA